MKYKLKSVDVFDPTAGKLVLRLFFEKFFETIEDLDKFVADGTSWQRSQGFECFANFLELDIDYCIN